MATVEHQHVKGLSTGIAQSRSEMTLNILGASNRLSTLERLVDQPLGQFNRGAQTRRFGRTKPRHRLERRCRSARQSRKAAKALKNRPGQRPGIPMLVTGPQNQRQEFGIR